MAGVVIVPYWFRTLLQRNFVYFEKTKRNRIYKNICDTSNVVCSGWTVLVSGNWIYRNSFVATQFSCPFRFNWNVRVFNVQTIFTRQDQTMEQKRFYFFVSVSALILLLLIVSTVIVVQEKNVLILNEENVFETEWDSWPLFPFDFCIEIAIFQNIFSVLLIFQFQSALSSSTSSPSITSGKRWQRWRHSTAFDASESTKLSQWSCWIGRW